MMPFFSFIIISNFEKIYKIDNIFLNDIIKYKIKKKKKFYFLFNIIFSLSILNIIQTYDELKQCKMYYFISFI